MKILRRVIAATIYITIICQLQNPNISLAHLIVMGVLVLIAGAIAWMFRPQFPKSFLLGSVLVVVVPAFLGPWLSSLRGTNDFVFAWLMLCLTGLAVNLVFRRR